MRKRLFAITLMGSLILAGGVQTYAVTPQYKPPHTDFTVDEIVDAVRDYLIENPIDVDIETPKDQIDTPKVEKAIYCHRKIFYVKDRLQIRWGKVKEADHYEVKIIKSNGESKRYKTVKTYLTVYTDKFMRGCIKGGSVKVRACGKNGAYSAWSGKKMITCNTLHR